MKNQRSLKMALSISRFRGRTALLIAAALMTVAISLSVIANGPHFITVSGNSSVSIDADSLKQGDVRFYAYQDHAGDGIRFLLARDATGRSKPPSTSADPAICIIRVTPVRTEISFADLAAIDTSWRPWNPGLHRVSL